MKTILNVTLSASGSPSEVKARIADQVTASGGSPDEAQALAAARIFIDKSLVGASEDDTLSVKATVAISVMDAPAIVNAKIVAAEDKAKATASQLAAVRLDLDRARTELEEAKSALARAQEPAAPVTQPGV